MFYFIIADYITISSLMTSYLVHDSENHSVPMSNAPIGSGFSVFICQFNSSIALCGGMLLGKYWIDYLCSYASMVARGVYWLPRSVFIFAGFRDYALKLVSAESYVTGHYDTH